MGTTMEMPTAINAAGASGQQFVTFHVQDELFGVPLDEVQEIIRMPSVIEVPLSPHSLEGIANLRGAVLAITSLRRVFGAMHVAHNDATRVVVVNRGGTPAGFIVDRMASVITAEAEEIEGADALERTVQSGLLRGVVKRPAGLILLLDPTRLTAVAAPAAQQRTGASAGAGLAAEPSARAGIKDAANEIQLVSFEVAGQEYAFPIDDVQEIVQVPDHLARVPRANPDVVGVMTLRNRLLPLVSLRRMFALPEGPVNEQCRIVVIAPGGHEAASVGIVMDAVKEVLRVSRSLVDPVPALLNGDQEGGNEFESICRLEDGKRLVTILSAQRMFGKATLRRALAVVETAGEGIDMAEEKASRQGIGAAARDDDEEHFVIFRLAGEEYGVPIDAVQEIVRVPEQLTRVPKAAAFLEGIVNLRGMVLPVVDQRRRFALEDAIRNDRQRIMVLTIGGIRTGFIVDSVSEVLKIASSAIGLAPALSEEQARLIRRVANLEAEKRMILLLDSAKLLGADEIETLEAL